MSLIRNYLLSLTRNAVRDKFFTLLNLLGLAIGITASILIFIYIRDQVTYDKNNEQYKRIYRLEGDFFINEKQDLIALVQIPLAPTLKDEYPEVEEYAWVSPVYTMKAGKTPSRKTALHLRILPVSRYSRSPSFPGILPLH